MNKTFFKIGLGWLALAGLAWPASGADDWPEDFARPCAGRRFAPGAHEPGGGHQ